MTNSSNSWFDLLKSFATVSIFPISTLLATWFNNQVVKSSNNENSSLIDSEPIVSPSLKDTIEIVKTWKKFHLAVDVGASNIRLAFLNPKDQSILLPPKTPCNSMTQLLNIFSEVHSLLGNSSVWAEASCLALAGPISGDRISVTNYEFKDSSIHKNDLPQKLFPKGRTYFLNDLEACSFGVVRMGLSGVLWKYLAPNNGIKTLQNHHYAVLAMGTGLGASLIFAVNTRKGNNSNLEFDVVPLELGHISLAHELEKDDRDRLDFVAAKIYGNKYSPEVEEICSGRGLVACYEYEIRDLPDRPNIRARDIADLVLKGDEYAQRAMHAHYRYLFKVAQHMCILVPQCKGVFLCGDNQVANESFVEKHLKEFEIEFFQNHPKKEWLENVNIYRQVKPLNLNLQGAFHYIDVHLKPGPVRQ